VSSSGGILPELSIAGTSSLLQQSGCHMNSPFSLCTLMQKSSLRGIWEIFKEANHTHILLSVCVFGINTNPLSYLGHIGERLSEFIH
jgi:hypothetical protein